MTTIEPGWNVAMDWVDAMLLHWPVSAASLRSHVPPASRSTRSRGRRGWESGARFSARASFVDPVRRPVPGTLEHWLVERSCFFTTGGGRTLRGDVAHEPWPIRDATAHVEENSLLEAAGILPLSPAPLAHVSTGVAARAWPLQDAF